MGPSTPGLTDSATPLIFAAVLAPQPSGAVIRLPGALSLAQAILERISGQDVVVCGDNPRENRRLARMIEVAVGPYKREDPHATAGTEALPHYQPENRPPTGHTFYETTYCKSKSKLKNPK